MTVTADRDLVVLLEAHLAEWLRVQGKTPGVTTHDDGDVVWNVQSAHSWGNAGTMLRFTEKSAGPRLTQILRTYRDAERGVGGFWVSAAATPSAIEDELKVHGLTCRKRFPVMHLPLTKAWTAGKPPAGIQISEMHDTTAFRRFGHPYWGRISTAIRRSAMDRLDALIGFRPQRVYTYAAIEKGEPVGATTLFIDKTMASVWDVGVPERARRRGIGSAVVAHACACARTFGARTAMLISSGEGEGMYRNVGFDEVTRFAFWYANLRAGAAARRAVLSTLLQTHR